MWATLIFFGTAILFLLFTLAALHRLRWVQRLPALESLSPQGGGPALTPAVRCSVVIAARDEEARIENTIRQLLGQQGVGIELMVVDDRSIDGTPEILRRLSSEEPSLKVLRVEELPEGWLGKCHACHVGASSATGDWILFIDADCWLKSDLIARAILLAERDGADHLTLSPGIVTENVWVRAWHLLFLTSLVNWFSGVNRDRRKSYMGIGAFNLVRAGAYRKCGGYQALRLTVLDDMKLGLLLRRTGHRTRAFLGVNDLECHWGNTVGDMIKIMEKNYFAVLEYRVWLVVVGVLGVGLVTIILVAGLISGSGAGLAAALSPLLLSLPAGILARRIGWTWPCAVLTPLMFPVFWYALINSTVVTLRQGGVRWRDTFYPLNILRAESVR